MNVENLQKLYEVGQKILRDQLPFGFGPFDCGTYACLSGWYGRIHGTKPSTAMNRHRDLFGIDWPTATAIFGQTGTDADNNTPEARAELSRRMEYLAELIVEAGGTVPNYTRPPTGIPDSVLAIFGKRVAA